MNTNQKVALAVLAFVAGFLLFFILLKLVKAIYNAFYSTGSTTYGEVFKGKDDKYYWRIKAGNHKIIAQSEGYSSKWNAERGLKRNLDRQ